MIAFEVSINGEVTCVAGVDPFGVVSVNAHWLRRATDPVGSDGLPVAESRLGVGGLTDEHSLRWISTGLAVGDVVRIRLVEVEAVDPPVATTPPGIPTTAREMARQERELYLRLRRKFERRRRSLA